MNNKIGVGCASITELEKKYVLDALDNQRLSQGKYVAAFEKRFSNMHNMKYGVMCNSGTTALELALTTLKEKENWDEYTEVLVPAITFIATSNACLHVGLKVIFVDVDSETYNINPNEIEKHITTNTKCIIPVHTFGMPCNMKKILKIAKRHNLKIVEDCAESHFAKINGIPVGSFGHLSVFSTYVAHTITTGIGGIVCTNSRDNMEILRSLVSHGRACTCENCIASDSDKVCPKRIQTDIDRRFQFVRLGYSYRVGEIEGALGLAQIERVNEIMNIRKKNAEYLTKELSCFEGQLQLPRPPQGIEHTYMMYPIVIKRDSGIIRHELVEYLERNNIETRPMLPLLNQPIYKKLFGNIEKDYPIAKFINNNGFYIGCHHELSKEDLKRVVKLITSFIGD